MKLKVYIFVLTPEEVKQIQALTFGYGFEAVPIVYTDLESEMLQAEDERKRALTVARAQLTTIGTTVWIPPALPKRTAAERLHEMFRRDPPACLITIQGKMDKFPALYTMPYEYRKRWLHHESVSQIKSECILECFAASQLPLMKAQLPGETSNPVICAISSAFHSKERILRPYHSLRAQTYRNWAWIIIDDSKNDETWRHLTELAESDSRIQVLKYSHHSGYIGKMKAAAGALAVTVDAKWIVELDHDDILVPQTFEWIVQASAKYPEVGFIHTDFIELFEKDERPFYYPGLFGFGYGCYMSKRIGRQWQHVYQSHLGNDPILMRYIVGVANHARCWRTDIYLKVGGFNPHLPVADDYELLLRTFFETRCLRIAEMCYLQFRNEPQQGAHDESGGNFTFRRNELIQDITRIVAHKYEPLIHKRALELWGKDCDLSAPRKENYKYFERRFVNADIVWFPDIENTVSIVMPTYNRAGYLRRAIASVLSQDYSKWRLYIVGDHCPVLAQVMNDYNDPRIQWWNLEERGGPGGHLPRNYALASAVVTPWVAFLDDDNTWEPNHLSSVIQRRNECPGVRCVVSSMKIGGRPLYFDEPKRGRVDTSCLFVETELIKSTGLMKSRIEDGYAHDWKWVERWLDAPFASTLLPTVDYTVDTNCQSYEEIYNMYPDQVELAKRATTQPRPTKHRSWNCNPRAKWPEDNEPSSSSSASSTFSSSPSFSSLVQGSSDSSTKDSQDSENPLRNDIETKQQANPPFAGNAALLPSSASKFEDVATVEHGTTTATTGTITPTLSSSNKPSPTHNTKTTASLANLVRQLASKLSP